MTGSIIPSLHFYVSFQEIKTRFAEVLESLDALLAAVTLLSF